MLALAHGDCASFAVFDGTPMMETTKQRLERLSRGEELNSLILERLYHNGLINISQPDHNEIRPDEKVYLFISFTEEGRKLLES